ncbi:MAG: endonuclease/exonuclease/phosphatase family protein [Alphaproteobacteria bacterium]|nr:endonuclease/exonuclease/phosphatase family protein [Alphaproteobacteria bacterium]
MADPSEPTPGRLRIARRDGGGAGRVVAALAALALALVWLPAVLAPTLGLPVMLIPVVGLLPLVAALLAAVLFGLWTVLPDQRALPWLVGLAVLLPLLRWGPVWGRRAPEADADAAPLRVATWNVRRLWGAGVPPTDERTSPEARSCLAGAVEALAPDVIALQEVTPEDARLLEGELGLEGCAWAPYMSEGPHAALGIAVCTRGGAWTLGAHRDEAYRPGGDWRFLRAAVSQGPTSVEVWSVHLAPHRLLADPLAQATSAARRLGRVAAEQEAQVDGLLGRLPADRPVVVAGDFNATRDLPVHARLRDRLTDAWEAGARGLGATVSVLGLLPVRIDFVYVRGAAVADARIPDVACSDHRPVVTDLLVPR